MKNANIGPLLSALKGIPTVWDGKKSILEMKEANFRWKDLEWIGFYFEFICYKTLSDMMKFHTVKYGSVSFDGFFTVPLDFKTHVINSESHQIITNDTQATISAISEYGCVIDVIALGEAEYNDVNRTFQKWHEKLKGGKSEYERERIRRGALSRLRKTKFTLNEIMIVRMTKETLQKSGSFQTGFRNADGSPRNSKVLLNLEKLSPSEIIGIIKFR